MILFNDVDLTETANNVRSFLLQDFQKAVAISGKQLTDIKSPTITDMPASHSNSNNLESNVINSVLAQTVVCTVHDTIFNCSNKSKLILIDKYINRYTRWITARDLGYSLSRFDDLHTKALNEFADRFQHYAELNHLSISDLHIYKSGNDRVK